MNMPKIKQTNTSASMRKNLSSGFANNQCSEPPATLRNLISTVVIRLLESIISWLAKSEILIF